MLLPAGFFCLWDDPESIQGVSTGSCPLSGASQVLALGPSAPRVVHSPLLQALHPPLAPSPFPKGMLAWGCPHYECGRGTGAPIVPKAGAVEHCWSWVFQWDAQHWRTRVPPDVETSFKHCHSMSPALAPWARACTSISAQVQHSLSSSGCPWAPTPDSVFISLIQNSPWPVALHTQDSFLPLPAYSPTPVQVAVGRTFSDPTLCPTFCLKPSQGPKITVYTQDSPACSLLCACLPCEASSHSIFSQTPCREAFSVPLSCFSVWDRFPFSLH